MSRSRHPRHQNGTDKKKKKKKKRIGGHPSYCQRLMHSQDDEKSRCLWPSKLSLLFSRFGRDVEATNNYDIHKKTAI